ncbi:MAG: transcription termination factor rho family protein [Cyanobacteria bacterium P01_F01_bin.150]
MSLSIVGNLMCLPFDDIEPGDPTDAHEYLIQSTANLLGSDRNWVPLIVEEVDVEQYQVVGNSFVYAVAAEAEAKEVWCIIIDPSPESIAMTKALAGELTPKTNLSTASRDEISAALDYLKSLPDKPLKGVNLASAIAGIDEAPGRQYWENLKPIPKLKCGITGGKKLDVLGTIFFLEPEPMPEVITDPAFLELFTATELKAMAKKRKLSGYSKLKKPALIEMLSQA